MPDDAKEIVKAAPRREDAGLDFDPGLVNQLAGGYSIVPSGGNSFFGPLRPLPGMAPDSVRGRQWDFPSAYNIQTQVRAGEAITMAGLRALADGYDLLRLVIETRKDQIEKIPFSVRQRQFPGQPRPKPTPGADAQIQEIESFLAMPDRIHPWNTWLRMLLEDMLVIDAATIYPAKTRGGDLFALEIMDGATIKRILNDQGRTPYPPDPAYQQILKGLPAVNYVLDEIYYLPRNPRSSRVYGMSPVEQVVMTVNIALRRQISQLEAYTEGNIPEALIGVPDNWSTTQIRDFQDWFDSVLEGNTAMRRKARFVPGQIAKNFVPTKDQGLKDEYDEWLARVVCYAFSVPPTPFIKQVNRNTAESAQQAALQEGLQPLLKWVKNFMDIIIAREFEAPGFEFAWLDEDEIDPAIQATINSAYVAAGIKNRNTARAELGLDPMDGGDVYTITAASVIRVEDAIAEPPDPIEMATAMAAAKQPPGAPGVDSEVNDDEPPVNDDEPPAKKKPAAGKEEAGKGADSPFVVGALPGASTDLAKWDESHPRDDKGKWTDQGGKVMLTATKGRAYTGKQVETKTTMTKQETGALAEKIAIAYAKQEMGFKDARALNLQTNNFPVDLVGDHTALEVKGGLVSNSPGAQQWRATIGEPGKAEKEWLSRASASEKADWNREKSAAILDRKNSVVADLSRAAGVKIEPRTVTVLINPDTKTADVHVLQGFHSRIGWNSAESKAGYVGTFKYK